MIISLKELQNKIECETAYINGKWVPARPVNWKYRTLKQRIKEAWYVFTGKADAFIWPEDQ